MNTTAILHTTEQRPYPLPSGPWIMTQTWNELLFAHWPIAPGVLRQLVPLPLTLDTFDGQCWLGVVPFYMTHVCPRGVPPLPWLSQFPELNVRTYVTVGGISGVYFFSLDAGNPVAVALARGVFHLPYFNAHMSYHRTGNTVHYHSLRTHRNAPSAEFVAAYRPIAPPFQPRRGTLEYFLAERYCLYTVVQRDHVYRADIHHRPWPLQIAELETTCNTMAQASGVPLPDTRPLLHYAQRQEVLVWPLHRVS